MHTITPFAGEGATQESRPGGDTTTDADAAEAPPNAAGVPSRPPAGLGWAGLWPTRPTDGGLRMEPLLAAVSVDGLPTPCASHPPKFPQPIPLPLGQAASSPQPRMQRPSPTPPQARREGFVWARFPLRV